MADWKEADHPRAPDGEFTSKAGWAGRVVSAIGDLLTGHHKAQGRDIRTKLDYEDLQGDLPGVISSSGRPDNGLGKIAALQGFDGKPEVVTKNEMDRRVAGGDWTELWRGVSGFYPSADYGSDAFYISGAEVAEFFRSGDYYPGVGIFGNGTYTSQRQEEVLGYGEYQSGGLLRMALRPDARVVDWDELQKIASKYSSGKYVDAVRERGTSAVVTAMDAGVPLEEAKKLRQPHRALADRLESRSAVLRDAGRLAAAMGYDAIAVQPRNQNYRDGRIMYHVVLNRTAVAVQEAEQEGQ